MKTRFVWFAALSACASVPPPASDCGRLRWGPPTAPTWVTMGSDETLELRVAHARVPVAGSTVHRDGQATFHPAFPLSPGLRYDVHSGARCRSTFVVGSDVRTSSPARALALYPTADSLPENILRFYIYFSKPMAEGRFLEFVRLTRESTQQDLTGVFFDSVYELWSSDRRRLTVLVDPGRVKTGLRAHAQQGRAFRAGETYTLGVRAGWPTLDGQRLEEEARWSFRVAPEERSAVDPSSWQLEPISSAPRARLRLRFSRPMDHVSVAHFIAVVSPCGVRLSGRWRLEEGDRVAEWTPASPWAGALRDHRLRVVGRLEDVAGNNLNAAFDHIQGALPAGGEDRTLSLAFSELLGRRIDETTSPATRQLGGQDELRSCHANSMAQEMSYRDVFDDGLGYVLVGHPPHIFTPQLVEGHGSSLAGRCIHHGSGAYERMVDPGALHVGHRRKVALSHISNGLLRHLGIQAKRRHRFRVRPVLDKNALMGARNPEGPQAPDHIEALSAGCGRMRYDGLSHLEC